MSDDEPKLTYYKGNRFSEESVPFSDPRSEMAIRKLTQFTQPLERLKEKRARQPSAENKSLVSEWGAEVSAFLENEVSADLVPEFRKILESSIDWPIEAKSASNPGDAYRQEQLMRKAKELDNHIRNKICKVIREQGLRRRTPLTIEQLAELEEEARARDPAIKASSEVQNRKQVLAEREQKWHLQRTVLLLAGVTVLVSYVYVNSLSSYAYTIGLWLGLVFIFYNFRGVRRLILGSHFPVFTEILLTVVLLTIAATVCFWQEMNSNIGVIIAGVFACCLGGVIYLNPPAQRAPNDD